MIALVLMACHSGPVDTDPADTDTVDTDVVDVGLRVVPGDPSLFATATLGLYRLDDTLFSVVDTTPAIESHLVDGAFAIAYEPATSDLVAPSYAPDMPMAAYAMIAWSGAPSGDGLIGATRFDAMYVTGTIPEQYAAIGLHAGWNAIAARDESAPDIGDPLAIGLDVNLVASAEATVGGPWGSVAGDYVAGLSTESADAAVATTARSEPWSLTASGMPPVATIRDLGGVQIAGFPVRAFTDDDEDGAWTSTDTVTADATSGGDPVWVAWGGPVDSLDHAHLLVTRGGFSAGWAAVRGTQQAFPLTADEAAAVVLSAR